MVRSIRQGNRKFLAASLCALPVLAVTALSGCQNYSESSATSSVGARVPDRGIPPGRDIGLFVDYPLARISIMCRTKVPNMQAVLAERWNAEMDHELAEAAAKAKREGEFVATSDRWVQLVKKLGGRVEAGWVTLWILYPSQGKGWGYSTALIDPRDGFLTQADSYSTSENDLDRNEFERRLKQLFLSCREVKLGD